MCISNVPDIYGLKWPFSLRAFDKCNDDFSFIVQIYMLHFLIKSGLPQLASLSDKTHFPCYFAVNRLISFSI